MAHTCANAVNGKDKVHNVLSSRVLTAGRPCVIKTKKNLTIFTIRLLALGTADLYSTVPF